MRIIKDQSIAIAIDIQERLFPHIYGNDDLLTKTEILVDGLNALGVQIHVTEQYKKGLGNTVESLEERLSDAPHYEKLAFSCCDDPELAKIFNSDKKFVILFGIETHICLLQTALDLKEKGYCPVIVEDCVSSRTLENKQIAINRMLQEDVIVTSVESLLFEMCRFAGTDEFKVISKLIK